MEAAQQLPRPRGSCDDSHGATAGSTLHRCGSGRGVRPPSARSGTSCGLAGSGATWAVPGRTASASDAAVEQLSRSFWAATDRDPHESVDLAAPLSRHARTSRPASAAAVSRPSSARTGSCAVRLSVQAAGQSAVQSAAQEDECAAWDADDSSTMRRNSPLWVAAAASAAAVIEGRRSQRMFDRLTAWRELPVAPGPAYGKRVWKRVGRRLGGRAFVYLVCEDGSCRVSKFQTVHRDGALREVSTPPV